jgi:hypothetical protein
LHEFWYVTYSVDVPVPLRAQTGWYCVVQVSGRELSHSIRSGTRIDFLAEGSCCPAQADVNTRSARDTFSVQRSIAFSVLRLIYSECALSGLTGAVRSVGIPPRYKVTAARNGAFSAAWITRPRLSRSARPLYTFVNNRHAGRPSAERPPTLLRPRARVLIRRFHATSV